MSIAASSLRMSPNRFSVRITSNREGSLTSCIAALSTSRWSSSTSGNPSAIRVTVSRHRREVSSTFALSTDVTRRRRPRGGFEPDPGDPLDLADRVLAGVVGAVGVAAGVAEVDPPGQLADDEQVGAADAVLAQRAGEQQGGARAHRPQVRVQAEALAQPEQALLGAGRVRVGAVPARASDGTEQHRIGGAARVEDLVAERDAGGVDRGSSDRVLSEIELSKPLEQANRGGDDLGADPVAREDGDPRRHQAGRRAETLSRTYSSTSGLGIEPRTASMNSSWRSSGSRSR